MLPKSFLKGFDKRRLRNVLALFFVALALPTAVLIWQAYGQLKWEAFHQYRGDAEELTRRIDSRLNGLIRAADARSFADYTFLVVTGDSSANFVQRSPLSAYPVSEDLPGALGYFQVDTAGTFSTPLLPPDGTDASSLGISPTEYAERLGLAEHIQTVLADNRLVQSRQAFGARREVGAPAAAKSTGPEEDRAASGNESGAFRDRQSAPRAAAADSVVPADLEEAETDAAAPPAEAFLRYSQESAPETEAEYSQQVFDQLSQGRLSAGKDSDAAETGELDDGNAVASSIEQRLNSIRKVSELRLDEDLQKKSAAVERQGTGLPPGAATRARVKRKEQIAVPESIPVGASEARSSLQRSADLRVSTFESEIDPFEFSLLDSGHFVFFRKVWRDGERYIQGLVVDQDAFVQEVIGARFTETALSGMSNLIVAFQEDVIQSFSGRDALRYPNVAEDLNGALLFRSRLSAPLNSLELIFSVRSLPPGPGAGVLGWVTLVLALVFTGGFVALYRLGLSQINLARQQQDFVSAVSHELKTPLTSIRMYGEMLKEGWAEEGKRQGYYEFIHDEAERLSRLITNVLQLARITRNDPQFDLKPIQVGALLGNTESKIASQVERAGFELRWNRTARAAEATVRVDEDCFAQIIINLIDNALKFSRDADIKAIELGCERTADGRVVFAVRDFGPGIPDDQMKKIFELFYRSESELTRETVGTGIGLAIVHQLTIAMGGSVDLVNRNPGAEFRIAFPIVD